MERKTSKRIRLTILRRGQGRSKRGDGQKMGKKK